MFYRGDVPAPECPCSAQVRDLFVWLCPAKKLIARVVFCVEQRDLRLLVCVCVCFSVSCGAGWEVGLESGTTEAAKSCVGSCIPGQSWAVGWAVHAVPRDRSWGCTLSLWERDCGASKQETQAGLVSECIIWGCVWGIVLGLWCGGPAEALDEMGILWLSGVSLSFRNCPRHLKIVNATHKSFLWQRSSFQLRQQHSVSILA